MEMTERAAATLGVKPEVDKVVAAGRSAPPTMKRRRDLMQHAPCWRAVTWGENTCHNALGCEWEEKKCNRGGGFS